MRAWAILNGRLLNIRANAARKAGDHAKRRRLAGRALDLLEPAVGPDHEATRVAQWLLEYTPRAEAELRQALEVWDWNACGLGGLLADTKLQTARGLKLASGYAPAEQRYREAIAALEKLHGPRSPEVAEALAELAELLALRGRLKDAERALKRARRIRAGLTR
jgi:tetratricopeptide (TPR) repeat protein